jgi:uncharacterized membrane protein YdjX (TVP38/TMEM64 family)
MANYIFDLYRDQPFTAIALVCATHFIFSFFGIPGGCTALNIGAGALFGLPTACAVIYPVTMFSAAAGYWVGRHFSTHRMAIRAAERLQSLMERLRSADFLFLVGLRLSPVVPFGLMNLACGVLGVAWPIYLLSTFVGIFFDVVLLASMGAALQVGPEVALGFAALVLVSIALRSWLFKSPARIRIVQ